MITATLVTHFPMGDDDNDVCGIYFAGPDAEARGYYRFCDWWRDESQCAAGSQQPVYLYVEHDHDPRYGWALRDTWTPKKPATGSHLEHDKVRRPTLQPT